MAINLSKLFNVDRRYIFLAVFLALLVPLLWPFGMPSTPTQNVRDMFDWIERAAARDKPVLLSFEFEPGTMAEHEPMARAILRHIFARHGKAVIINKSGGQQGQTLHLQIISDCAQEFNAREGEDYVYLPWQIGTTTLVINMGQNFQSAYPTDNRRIPLSDIPLTRDIGRLADFYYSVVVCSSMTIVGDWLTVGQGPYSLNMGFAVLGSAAPDAYNYINSRQIKGFLGGLVGAAQYESLLVEQGITLRRKFSAADLSAAKVPVFCRKLLATRDTPIGRHVWNALSAEQREAVQHSVDWGWFGRGSDQFKKTGDKPGDRDDKKTLTDALNELISGNASQAEPGAATQPAEMEPLASTQPASQPGAAEKTFDPAHLITDADLKGLKLEAKTRELLDSKPFEASRPQILRRLYVESKFPGGLVEAQSYAQATRLMTPQSFAHVVLIIAVLLANVAFLVERRKKGRTKV